MKRLLLSLTLLFLSLPPLALRADEADPVIIEEISELSPTRVKKILAPVSIEEIQEIIKDAKVPLSIAGARCSQGGQIAYEDGIVIDMSSFNDVIELDTDNQTVTVQTGITWKKLIEYIDPHDLSVRCMQSYSDFSVGGTLSVNAHGRTVHDDPIISTVQSITIINAQGNLIEASRTKNSDYFYNAIGGYGLVGVIVQATLRLRPSTKIKYEAVKKSLDEYKKYFFEEILPDKTVRLQSAYLCPVYFDQLLSATWRKTAEPVTDSKRLRKGIDWLERIGVVLSRSAFLRRIRSWFVPYYLTKQKAVIYENSEKTRTIQSLKPLIKSSNTGILQEYFIPVEHFESFAEELKNIIQKYKVNLLNIGIRYVEADKESALPYAPQDSFAFVLYMEVPKSHHQENNKIWTQKLVDQALRFGGRYYLPYHLYPTKEQLKKTYPELDAFLAFKKSIDPEGKFRNSLFKKYLEAEY